MKDKKILVTGGAGFIGSNLVKELVTSGNKVIVADILLRGNKIEKRILDSIEFYKTDVRNADSINKLAKGCDFIFHLAAVLGVDVVADNPVETMETEVLGAINICNAAIENDVETVIYSSTSGVYGHSVIDTSVTEEIEISPKTSYAMAKRYNEIYLMSQFQEKRLNSISLRFFNVYGANQDSRMVIPRFFEQALKNEPITVFGDGNQTRDFTYIDDVVISSIKLAEKIKGSEIFNISNENELSIKELAEKIVKITKSSSKIDFVNAPKKRYDFEVERRFGNSDKLYKAVGYKPNSNIDEKLEIIYNHIKENGIS